MSGARQVPVPAAVAGLRRTLKIHARGCLQPVPDRADPLAVAVHNQCHAFSGMSVPRHLSGSAANFVTCYG